MRQRFGSAYGPILSCALILVAVVVGCSEDITNPEAPLFAKPGSTDGVEVTATNPDSSVQDTTLFVDVLGDGFDDGSTVEFMIDENTVATKLKVKNTHYVNKRRLRVELEVDASAEFLRYDVHVTARRGPKGIGTELFRVVQKESPSMQEFQLTDFQVIEVPDSVAPDRCPDATNPCNEIRISYTGSLEYLQLRLVRVYDEYFDPEIEERRLALGGVLPGASEILYPSVPGELVGYWQGQWIPRVWEDPMGPSHVLPPEPRTAFAPFDEPSAFTFGYSFRDHFGSRMSGAVIERFPEAIAYFRGPDPVGLAYAKIDDVELVTVGRKKHAVTTLNFIVYAFSSPVVQDINTTLHAYHRTMVTYEDGTRIMARHTGGTGLPDSPYGSLYKLDVPPAGTCLELRVIGMEFVSGVWEENWDHRFYAWDPAQDPAGAAPLGVLFDGEAITTILGGCR